MRSRWAAVALTVLVVVGLIATAAVVRGNLNRHHSTAAIGADYGPEGYTWPQGTQVRIEDRTGSGDWRVALIRAVDLWDATGANVHLTYTSTPSFAGPCAPHGTTVSVCRADLVAPLAGQAHMEFLGADLRSAWVEVTTGAVTAVQAQGVVCHELGHSMGLGHTPDIGSCMNPDIQTAGPGSSGADSLLSLYPPVAP